MVQYGTLSARHFDCQRHSSAKMAIRIIDPRQGVDMLFPAILPLTVLEMPSRHNLGAPQRLLCAVVTGITWLESISLPDRKRPFSWDEAGVNHKHVMQNSETNMGFSAEQSMISFTWLLTVDPGGIRCQGAEAPVSRLPPASAVGWVLLEVRILVICHGLVVLEHIFLGKRWA